MGRFPWSPGHGGEKLHTVAQEWFSRDATEPSRQAWSEMRKEYTATKTTDPSPKRRMRSRAYTGTSTLSTQSRTPSDRSNGPFTRPSSRQSLDGLAMPASDRHDQSPKSILSKGTRLLRRQGSKMNLLQSHADGAGAESLDNGHGGAVPRTGLQRQFSVASKRSGLKGSISGPFAFQHVSHADQAQFRSLDTVTRIELTQEFAAVQADQRPDVEIRGIPVTSLPARRADVGTAVDEAGPEPREAAADVPTTPPPRALPRKDMPTSPSTPYDARLSRSMENFSRPTRCSIPLPDVAPHRDSFEKLAALSPIKSSLGLEKPLPLLPNTVHAVSTRDDIALPLRTSPLPSPPTTTVKAMDDDEAVAPSSPTVPDTVVPPSRDSDRDSFAQMWERRRASSSEPDVQAPPSWTTTPSGHSESNDIATTWLELPTTNRLSIGTKPIDIGDWEDAIDYSWEHATEIEAAVAPTSVPLASTLGREVDTNHAEDHYLVVQQQANDEASSSASTPLTMFGPSLPVDMAHVERKLTLGRPAYDEPSSPLLGLGIASVAVPAVAVDASTPVHESHVDRQSLPRDMFRTSVVRSPGSSISKSSSQESVILSIASSIIGTHRSSHSSTSLSEFSPLAQFGESVENLKLDLHDPSETRDIHLRENSQDTVRQEPFVSATDVVVDAYMTASAPTLGDCEWRATTSCPRVPARSSSIDASATKIPGARKRAGTASSRSRRNTRVSYSLFPVAQS